MSEAATAIGAAITRSETNLLLGVALCSLLPLLCVCGIALGVFGSRLLGRVFRLFGVARGLFGVFTTLLAAHCHTGRRGSVVPCFFFSSLTCSDRRLMTGPRAWFRLLSRLGYLTRRAVFRGWLVG